MSSFSATTLLALLGASTAFAATPPAPPTYGGGADACATACVAAFRTCQGDTSNTRAQCAADLSSCVGYAPFDNSGSFVLPTTCSATTSAAATPSAPPTYGGGADACAANCVTAFRTCQSNLSNTRAQCAADLSSCVGYVPFDNSGSFVTPTACSATASTTATASASTSSAPKPTGDCAATCVAAFRTCQSNLSNTRAQCAADLSSCVGYVPFDNSGSFVTPTACSGTSAAPTQSKTAAITTGSAPKPTGDCAANCVAAFRTCQSNLSNTRAQCAADLSSCVGYVPFDNSGSFVTPTACSGTSAAPTQSKTAAITTGSAPAPTTTGSSSSCAANCIAAFRTCQSDTNNTRALCASNLATCVGYVPFDNSGSFVTPTACSSIPAIKTGNATTTAPAIYTGAAALTNTGGSLAAVAVAAVALLV